MIIKRNVNKEMLESAWDENCNKGIVRCAYVPSKGRVKARHEAFEAAVENARVHRWASL
jgi:hypothetical protein